MSSYWEILVCRVLLCLKLLGGVQFLLCRAIWELQQWYGAQRGSLKDGLVRLGLAWAWLERRWYAATVPSHDSLLFRSHLSWLAPSHHQANLLLMKDSHKLSDDGGSRERIAFGMECSSLLRGK